MIEFGGTIYYIDIDALDKAITPSGVKTTDKIKEVQTTTTTDAVGNSIVEQIETTRLRGKEIDGAKYDILRMMIEVLIDYQEEIDDTLGSERAFEKTNVAYKIAFNTLFNYGILKEKE